MTNSNALPVDIQLGYVHLTVANLDRSLAFYQDIIGLELHQQQTGTAYLGVGDKPLLRLTEQPNARRVSGTTGLYHFAILVPSRLALAQSLKRIAETRTPVEGFADHLVSEAIYLPDPDGNGIEIYRDRPRTEWTYEPNGRLNMGTDPLDVEGVLGELAGNPQPWTGLHPDTVMGHIHLHVAHLEEAETFYRDVLGFDLMLQYGGMASFLSVGGYHHHLGFNTWAGVGAPPPPTDALGLRWWTINLPNQAALDQLLAQLAHSDIVTETMDEGWFLRDPAQNGLMLAVSE
ncbi:MAG: VOC family protein [Chloroflexota bacterium]